jgi:hypothetical protein
VRLRLIYSLNFRPAQIYLVHLLLDTKSALTEFLILKAFETLVWVEFRRSREVGLPEFPRKHKKIVGKSAGSVFWLHITMILYNVIHATQLCTPGNTNIQLFLTLKSASTFFAVYATKHTP